MLTISRILCPVDLSDASQHAVDHAVALARWYGASITALHIYDPQFAPVESLPHGEAAVSDAERQRVIDETLTYFRIAGATDVKVDTQIGFGHPAQQILDRAAIVNANLIVMGTHGASGFEHLVLGSVTEKVLRKARCPVLTVPPHAHSTSKLPFHRLLCGVDFSDWSLTAVELTFSIAQESDAAVTLLHVIEWPWEEPPAPNFAELPPIQAQALLDHRRSTEKSAVARLEQLVPSGLPRTPTLRFSHGKPYAEILRVAGEESADLIVTGVHGRNALDLTLFGSTTNQVVRRATCPVLTLRH